MTPTELWISTHTKNLLAAYPDRSAESAAEGAAKSASYFSRASQGYSKEGPALKATCKALGIKQTYKDIFAFFGAVPAPRPPKAPTMSREAALAKAQLAREEKVLAKLINSSRYGRVMPLKQFIRCLVEEGATVVQMSRYKNKRSADTILVEGLLLGAEKGSNFWGAPTIPALALNYAKRILSHEA